MANFYLDDFNSRNIFPKFRNLMRTDIKEEDDRYLLEVELPGFNKEDIKLSLEDNYLTVSAERKGEVNNDRHGYLRRERYYGSYSRSFYVGDIQDTDVTASYQNGILKITYPKETKEEKNYITIE
ncbi:MAG: Hsp20/alpha crystallin family protein [Acholeplasmataceae bacterium]|mgnify:CR=1 FL=1|nr:Hsp20/alpha crystallin family protein [Acholeplasmataceae bacterium]